MDTQLFFSASNLGYHMQFFWSGWHTTHWYLDLEEFLLFNAALAQDQGHGPVTSPYAEETRLITQDGCLLRVNEPVIQIGTCQRFDGRNGDHATWTLCPFREQLDNLQCLLEPGITWLKTHAPEPEKPPVHRPQRRSPYPGGDASLWVQ